MTDLSPPTHHFHAADGTDVTEGVQVILDGLHWSLNAGSGFLDWREWCAIRQVAWALGLNPDLFTDGNERHSWATPVGLRVDDSKRRVPWPDPSAPLTDSPDGIEDDA